MTTPALLATSVLKSVDSRAEPAKEFLIVPSVDKLTNRHSSTLCRPLRNLHRQAVVSRAEIDRIFRLGIFLTLPGGYLDRA
jgi:hypothetical protein